MTVLQGTYIEIREHVRGTVTGVIQIRAHKDTDITLIQVHRNNYYTEKQTKSLSVSC